MADRDILAEAREAFRLASEAEQANREAALDDLRFARLGEQWPDDIVRQRRLEGRPCLTINRLPAFIRQVVNDARQMKPSVKVHPVDSAADPETAEIFNGLIRHIEYASNADVAYDTAIESAVGMGFGYWRVGLDYADSDSFELDIRIDRIADPFTVYGDPDSTAADSSDWNSAFVVELMRKAAFEAAYKGAEAVDWAEAGYTGIGGPWFDESHVMVAEWWTREQADVVLIRLTNGTVVDETRLKDRGFAADLARAGVAVDEAHGPRQSRAWKVRQRILTGAETLEERDWPGRYIPIVPVYGDEVNVEGERHFRSLIRDAKDAQRMFNYWRTTSTELVALAPRVPFIGPKGSFTTDAEKWSMINRESHAFVEYDDKGTPPQRQPLESGPAGGAMQEAINASDDMKAIMGLHDASLGMPSNETSGRAILARMREGDTSTFHFVDNLSRAIRYTGRVLLDLIPHIHSEARVVRVIGEDCTQDLRPINQEKPVLGPDGQPRPELCPDGRSLLDPATGEPKPMVAMHDVRVGKYDLTVTTGPSFTSRREEAAAQMIEMVRAFPQIAPVIGDLVAHHLDWPGADEIAKRLKAMLPPEAKEAEAGGLPNEIKTMIAEGQKLIQQLQGANQRLKADVGLSVPKLDIEMFQAETDRMKALSEIGPQGPALAAAARMPMGQGGGMPGMGPPPMGALAWGWGWGWLPAVGCPGWDCRRWRGPCRGVECR